MVVVTATVTVVVSRFRHSGGFPSLKDQCESQNPEYGQPEALREEMEELPAGDWELQKCLW
ncbi:hypothetical protein HanRHA438_Chr05g0208131 [Helianthus annuus]|uniref:Uncharacterized protein n=1 Tax=Helianthus annuus TaxID=4232 RepID=A0A251ULU1_HELAN|nr:hypothetical protein HanXRQr2_Chr05g0198531 [Helianthus annuus]KAJ0569172.1 hypothetical protein HanHA300_Chr05g0163021 [Helianthus annuus]KAJ0575569.1 hypothetical protein HanIR_Chr05g0214221 [Helianthus annuus]KAJ0583468.1 hypothetical protein HanHA89_Chr05g0176911 [Helianthus annuus]KAJ0746202.1 hypothetical protein HanOQP8_Chr05g0174821 [Helianthus annuus]